MPSYKNLNATNIVNVINNAVNQVYNTSLPAVTKATFSDMADQLRRAPQPVQNAWHDSLINLVGMQILKNKRAYESYFRKLHLGEIATFDVQLLMVDLIKARAYSPNADADDFFADEKPDIEAQYANSILKAKFPVSINEENLYGAFISEDRFMDYMSTIDSVLYSSLEMADVEAVEKLINENITEGNIYIEVGATPENQATALAFTKNVKAIAEDMAVKMSPKYNLAAMNTWTPKDEGVIISDTETKAISETYSLAWAFNKSYLDLEEGGRAITVARGSLADGKVYAIYADRLAFEIRNIIGFPKTVSQYFGNTLTLKRWLHYWALYTISFFNNVVAFADSDDVGISAATIALKSGLTALNKGAKDKAVVTGITAASNKIADKFGTWSFNTASVTSTATTIDPVTGELHIGADETGITFQGYTGNYIQVVWTSHLDNNVTADMLIKINS